MRVLVDTGAEGLTIDRLRSELGVTKGSFYHHFGGFPGFLEAFLEHLEQAAFADVVGDIDEAAPAGEQLRLLNQAIAGDDPALEVAVRRWAAALPEAQSLIDRIDGLRLDHLEGLLRDVLTDRTRARFLARLYYAIYIGGLQLNPPVEGAEYLAMTTALEQLTHLEGTS